MRRWLLVFLTLITVSCSSLVKVPVCCVKGRHNYGFVASKSQYLCKDTFGNPDSVFTSRWKNHEVNWTRASIRLCSRYYSRPDEDIRIDSYGNLITTCSEGQCCGNYPPRYSWEENKNKGYCMDYVNGSLTALICVKSFDILEDSKTWKAVTTTCWAISAILLSITCALIWSERSNKRSASYDRYVISQSLAMIATIISILCNNYLKTQACWPCMMSGYALQYFGLSAFFWMNAKVITVYRRLSGYGYQQNNKESKVFFEKLKWREFLKFSVYAWGMPLLISATTYFLQMSDILEDFHDFQPDIGAASCFLLNRITKWIYFYVPMAVISTTNIMLFALTAYILAKNQNSTRCLKKGKKSRMQREIWYFNQYLKLFIATGITWTAEVVNWSISEYKTSWVKTLSRVLEIIVSIQGVLMFYFFVFQSEELSKKLFCTCTSQDQDSKQTDKKLYRILCFCYDNKKSSVDGCPSACQENCTELHDTLMEAPLEGKRCSSRNLDQNTESRNTNTNQTYKKICRILRCCCAGKKRSVDGCPSTSRENCTELHDTLMEAPLEGKRCSSSMVQDEET